MSGSNLFVITGGPGSGKSTLISALRDAGFAVAEEAGREIIRYEIAMGGRALPWADRQLFAERMLELDVARYDALSESNGPVFFDRGIPDVAGYLRLSGLPVPDALARVADTCRYNRLVFLAPYWADIYTHDGERRQTPDEAARTGEIMRTIYSEYGYEPLELPRASVDARVRFVLDASSAG
jgi:predicted ATPase